jgi:cobalamin biosynthesis protein CobT
MKPPSLIYKKHDLRLIAHALVDPNAEVQHRVRLPTSTYVVRSHRVRRALGTSPDPLREITQTQIALVGGRGDSVALADASAHQSDRQRAAARGGGGGSREITTAEGIFGWRDASRISIHQTSE